MAKVLELVDGIKPVDDIEFKKIVNNEYHRSGPIGVVEITAVDGEKIFRGIHHNKIIAPGAEFLARAMFDLPGNYSTKFKTYNNILDLDNTINTPVPGDTYKTCLFCMGIGGCGRENSQVFEPDYRHIIDETRIIPFQYRPLYADINTAQRTSVYQGRKVVDNKYIAYYFKHFDSDPTLYQQFTTGEEFDELLYKYTGPEEAQTIVKFAMSVTTKDFRDYFFETVGINECRVNELSLCLGWEHTVDGWPVYQDIRPVTNLSFPNEPLISLRKSISIDYSIYF